MFRDTGPHSNAQLFRRLLPLFSTGSLPAIFHFLDSKLYGAIRAICAVKISTKFNFQCTKIEILINSNTKLARFLTVT